METLSKRFSYWDHSQAQQHKSSGGYEQQEQKWWTEHVLNKELQPGLGCSLFQNTSWYMRHKPPSCSMSHSAITRTKNWVSSTVTGWAFQCINKVMDHIPSGAAVTGAGSTWPCATPSAAPVIITRSEIEIKDTILDEPAGLSAPATCSWQAVSAAWCSAVPGV